MFGEVGEHSFSHSIECGILSNVSQLHAATVKFRRIANFVFSELLPFVGKHRTFLCSAFKNTWAMLLIFCIQINFCFELYITLHLLVNKNITKMQLVVGV